MKTIDKKKKARELLASGLRPMQIVEITGLPKSTVYGALAGKTKQGKGDDFDILAMLQKKEKGVDIAKELNVSNAKVSFVKARAKQTGLLT